MFNEFKIPENYLIKLIPNFNGSAWRFMIRHEDMPSDESISVYCDLDDSLGCVGQPYYEAYPVNGDAERFLFGEENLLIEAIKEECQRRMPKKNGGNKAMSFSTVNKRPNGLISIPENKGQILSWYYKAPTGQVKHVGSYDFKSQELILTCHGFQTTQTTKKCIRSVFADLLNKDFNMIIGYTKKGEFFINGLKIEFDKPIKVFNENVTNCKNNH